MGAVATDGTADYARALARACAGGLLFGIPLLFTMEVWWHGFLMPWWKILVLLGATAVFIAFFLFVAGFRRASTPAVIAVDTLVALGIGIVVGAVALVVLGQLGSGSSLREVTGKIALEAVPIAMGAAVARELLGEVAAREEREREEPGAAGQALLCAAGAMLFAFNIAPTEEPMLLGIENDWIRIVTLLALMFPVAGAIVFYADFRGSHRKRDHGGSPLLTPAGETLLAVAVSLVVSALLLWLFGRIGADTGVGAATHQIVTLGFPAVIGASAARLLV